MKMRFIALLLIILIQFIFIPLPKVYAAATSPGLGQAASFAILSSTYTNTVGGTTINGDLGYTTGPAVTPTVNGTTFGPSSKYSTAGTDQAAALANLNGQACTYTWSPGAINLATDNLHNGGGTPGQYLPGVYCTGASSAASIGTQGITLVGSGTYIFKINGALTTVDNSVVTLSGGASACDLFWAPAEATTLGANTTFAGTDIDASGITIGSTVTWTGRALVFGGTVSTATDTISSTTCTAATSLTSSSTSSTGGGTTVCPIINNVTPIIIESKRIDADSIFISWGPYSGTDKFIVHYGLENGKWLYSANVTGFSTTLNALSPNQPIWVQAAARNDCSIGIYGEAKLVGGPSLPNTGFAPHKNNIPWYIPIGITILVLTSLVVVLKKRTI